VKDDPTFHADLQQSLAEASAGKFVNLKMLEPIADALVGLADEKKENTEV